MATTFSYTPSYHFDLAGWNKWTWLPTTIEGTYVPYGLIPSPYLPSSSIWLDSETIHCDVPVPWQTWTDPFSVFLSYAQTGTVAGTLVGLDQARNLMDQKVIARYGLAEEYLPPHFAYTIGDQIKEEIFVNMFALQVTTFFVLSEVNEDLIIRSNFSRVYVNHGEIQKVSEVEDDSVFSTYYIDIGVEIGLPESVERPASKRIKVTKSDGTYGFFEINNINTNWELEISNLTSSGFVPSSGDFYQLVGEVWVIEDPYLMDGYWYGSEQENVATDIQSGFDLFLTNQNQPYVEGTFTGAFLLQSLDDENTSIVNFNAGSPFTSSGSDEWLFYPLANYAQSELYGNSQDRYQLRYTQISPDNVVDEYSIMSTATNEQYTKYVEQNNVSFIRLEMQFGQRDVRTNFAHPCLVGQYIVSEGYFHKIVGQANGHTIDVLIKSVDGEHNLDPLSNPYYAILNQYAWLMNEYEMGPERRHIFEGVVTSLNTDNGTTVVRFDVKGENEATWTDLLPSFYSPDYFDNKSYFERFTKTHQHGLFSPSDVKIYEKYQNWRLNTSNKNYQITDFSAQIPASSGETYQAECSITSDDSISVGDTVYITFRNPPDKEGIFDGSLNLQAEQGTDTESGRPKLCLFGSYLSPKWNVDAPVGTHVNICAGYYFGTVADTPLSDSRTENATVFVTTRKKDISCSAFYDNVSQEHCVAFVDNYTRRITLRQGTINYEERPRKLEVSIGYSDIDRNPSYIISSIPGSFDYLTELSLDASKERCKTIQYNTEIDDNIITTFDIKTQNDKFGFIVTGEGETKLRGLTRAGVEQTDYTFEGAPVSPIYVYKPGRYSKTDQNVVYMGMSTDDSPIYINDEVKNLSVEYVNERQTIQTNSYFDLHLLDSGEYLLIYGQAVGQFSLTNTDDENEVQTLINNSSQNNNKWVNSTGIFAVISVDGGSTWMTPNSPSTDSLGIGKPLLVMGDAEYMGSLYDNLTGSLLIFAKRQTDNLGTLIVCYQISTHRLLYKSYECTPDSESALPFLYRPPALSENTIKENFTPQYSIINDGYEWSYKKDGINDEIVKVAGNTSDVDVFLTQTDFGNTSISQSDDGVIIFMFTGENGIRVMFSRDNGSTWDLSDVILARNADCGIAIDQGFCYIKEETLYCKTISPFSACTSSSDSTLQKKFDDANEILIKTFIPNQKLASYQDGAGMTYVFYYNQDRLLGCSRSRYADYSQWETLNNF